MKLRLDWHPAVWLVGFLVTHPLSGCASATSAAEALRANTGPAWVVTNATGQTVALLSRAAYEAEFRYLRRQNHALDLARPGGRMTGLQADVPETQWPFLQFCYAGLAGVNLARSDSAFRAEALAEVRWLIDALQTPRLTGFMADHFGPPFGPGFSRPSVFVHGFFLNLVLRYRAVSGDTQHDTLSRQIAEALFRAFEQSDQGILPSYPHLWWLNDNLPALAALVAYDQAFHADLAKVRHRFLESVRANYLDRLGLLSSYIDPGERRPLQAARGVSIAYALHFLRDVDPGFAQEQYSLAKKIFYRTAFGFTAVREFSEDEPPAFDVDSGPVVFGLGSGASGFAIGASAVMGDEAVSDQLLRASLVVGLPVLEGDELRYDVMPPVGQAVVLFGKTEWLARQERASPVRLSGRSFADANGPFLGLGVSYFQALRHAKYDRARLESNLHFLARQGFNYVRVLSMVGWDGLEIAPVSFTNKVGHRVEAWPDYWQQFRDLLDLVSRHQMRAEITIFADAQYVMPSRSLRMAHLDGVLAGIAGREAKVMHLEVANEAWQNGFPGTQGVADLRAFAQHLGQRTEVLVAITSNDDTSDAGIASLYRGSAADLATVHFSRDIRGPEGGWLPVRDCYRAGHLSGVPPVSSNEPIGPGSSVNSESDPIRLASAAVFAYLAGLPAYVFHSSAGVYARDRFQDTPGVDAFRSLQSVLPGDLASWTRHDGREAGAPFTVFCNGQPDRYWPDVPGATNGCHRSIGSVKGDDFVSLPMGILPGGVVIEARRPLRFQRINPLTGVAEVTVTLGTGQGCALPQGPGAWILRGRFTT